MRYLLLLVLLTLPVSADTILTVLGPPASGGQIGTLIDNSFLYTLAWTQTSTYTDVIVKAQIGWGPNTGHAYLTTHLGPGTTLADQVAASTFSVPETPSFQPILTAPLLGPGTYYLSMTSTDPFPGFGWFWTNNPTTTSDDGVTILPRTAAGLPTDLAYAPAAPVISPYPERWVYEITGNPVSAVPEPSTIILTASMLCILATMRWQHKRVARHHQHTTTHT